MADEADVFNWVVSANYLYDSNLFRASDGVDPISTDAISDRSDSILTYSLGFNIDKPYRQQRFEADFSVSANRYQNYSFLDFDATQYFAAWRWHLTPRFSGTLSARQSESLNGFDNNRTFSVQNVRTDNTYVLDADYWASSRWHMLAGVHSTVLDNSRAFSEDDDFEQLNWSLGVAYTPGSGRSLRVRYKSGDGEYTSRTANPAVFLDDGFEDRRFELGLTYPVSELNLWTASLEYQDRSHPLVSQRDFSGWGGNVTWQLDLSSKLRIETVLQRQLGAWQDGVSNYQTTDTLRISPIWSLSAKQTVQLSLSYAHRQHGGRLPGVVGTLRDDGTYALSATWYWQPVRVATLSAGLQHSWRDSNINGLDYRVNSFSLGANAKF